MCGWLLCDATEEELSAVKRGPHLPTVPCTITHVHLTHAIEEKLEDSLFIIKNRFFYYEKYIYELAAEDG